VSSLAEAGSPCDADRGHARPTTRPASAPGPRTGRAGAGGGRDHCAAWWTGRGRAHWDRPARAGSATGTQIADQGVRAYRAVQARLAGHALKWASRPPLVGITGIIYDI
jgi:hypothetical protein